MFSRGRALSPRSPALWQLFRIAHSPLPFLENCARHFGNAFTVRMARLPPYVVLADPPEWEVPRQEFPDHRRHDQQTTNEQSLTVRRK